MGVTDYVAVLLVLVGVALYLRRRYLGPLKVKNLNDRKGGWL
jgi:hypothetical protein